MDPQLTLKICKSQNFSMTWRVSTIGSVHIRSVFSMTWWVSTIGNVHVHSILSQSLYGLLINKEEFGQNPYQPIPCLITVETHFSLSSSNTPLHAPTSSPSWVHQKLTLFLLHHSKHLLHVWYTHSNTSTHVNLPIHLWFLHPVTTRILILPQPWTRNNNFESMRK